MKKYRKGTKYKTVHSLFIDLEANKYVYWREKVKHPSIIGSMQLRTVMNAVINGVISKAILNK